MAARNPRLRAFVKVDKLGQVVAGTLILRYKPPKSGLYLSIRVPATTCPSLLPFTKAHKDFVTAIIMEVNGD